MFRRKFQARRRMTREEKAAEELIFPFLNMFMMWFPIRRGD